MNRNREIESGFTLVELLAVIAIIGILAAVLLPALSHAKANARSATCKNRMHQIGLALQSYVNDHQNNYPYYVNPSDPSLNDAIGPSNTRYWWAKLIPYYPLKWTNATYHCPGYQGVITGEQPGRNPPYGSYAYNGRGVSFPQHGFPYKPTLGLGPGPYVAAGQAGPRSEVPEARIKMPSEMLAISESRFVSAKVNGLPGGKDESVCGLIAALPFLGRAFTFDPARHGKNYNLLLCDGHVASMNPWILFNPTNSAVIWNSDHQPHPELWVP